jgi:phosphate ABC transporter phosphate-binding protein
MTRHARTRSRWARIVLGLAAALVGLTSTAGPALAAPDQALPAISGAGSTWSQNALDQWRADVTRQGLSVNYQGVGSTAGRNLFRDGSVDFAVSEVPYQPGENPPPFEFVYLPIVAGGTAVIYKVTDSRGQPITNLRLSPGLAARVFTRKVTKWNDPAIAQENPGVALPNLDITVVVRSDGSGTSFQFSAYLANRAPAIWQEFTQANNIRSGPTSNWPTLTGATGQNGSDGVANYVAQGNGAITYAETSYAIERRLPVASIRNEAGNYVLPTATNVSIALAAARFNADRTQVLDGVYVHPHANAYPISSYSYMLARTTGMNPDKGRAIARFVYHFACAGQQKAAPLGYSPLPSVLVKAAFEAIVTVPGAEPPPVIAPETCKNPAVTGSFTVPGGSSTPPPSTGGPQTGSATSDPTGDAAGAGPDEPTSGDGTAIDIDGDGIPDGVDLDGDGIIDETLDGEELAAPPNPEGSVRLTGDSRSVAPLAIGTLCLLGLLLVPPVLLAAGIPGRRWWHRLFGGP